MGRRRLQRPDRAELVACLAAAAAAVRLVWRACGSWRLASGRLAASAARRKKVAPSVSEPPVLSHPPPAPDDRPRRRTTELRPELRADVDLSEADGLHREVERGYRRQGAEGRRARRSFRARIARGLGDEEGDRRYDQEQVRFAQKHVEVADAEVKAARRGWMRPRRSWASTRPRSSAGTSRSSGSTVRSSGRSSPPRSFWSPRTS